jgi:Zn finger protein HypA/HybF involved in hydrogenase expression
MIKKHGEKCMECGWNEINIHTGKIPIELEHIDGNFINNNEENLKLLCPNCHSLTSTYKGANKKKGRPRAKYYRGM